MIKREDMLELTRRMTIKRNCFDRIAGAYMDREGFIDDTFNIHFLKLKDSEKAENIALAKTVPFAKTNEELKEYTFTKEDKETGGIHQLLLGIRECGLKNDALLYLLYEWIGERYESSEDYAIFVFHGRYDVPVTKSEWEDQWESEEIYDFLIITISPLNSDREPLLPEKGVLFPAFSDRSTDTRMAYVFTANGHGK